MTVLLNWNQEVDTKSADIERWIPLLERLLFIVAKKEQLDGGEVSLTFVDDETIRQLNRDYRNVDEATDVLSFALDDDDSDMLMNEIAVDEADENVPRLWGDIIISIPTAERQSEQYGHSLDREIGFLFVHGFLHLLGYDHQDDDSEREMFRIQEEVLNEAGLTR